MQVPFPQLATGTRLENRYCIRSVLGQGGMSRVYLADDERLGIRVAVKENLQLDPASRRQFLQEAHNLAGVLHPNLPVISDSFEVAGFGRQYLVMTYIEGENLEDLVARAGPLREDMALAWIRQILDALIYIHSHQPPIIHRDIKPANIKITPQGKAVLVDFGISKTSIAGHSTLTGARALTPGYAPPEQYSGHTDVRSDIYSLGATLYILLTGHEPPEAPLRTANAAKLIPPRQVNPAISPLVERAILRALETDMLRRWQRAEDFAAALAPAPAPATPVGAGLVPAPPSSAPSSSPQGGAGTRPAPTTPGAPHAPTKTPTGNPVSTPIWVLWTGVAVVFFLVAYVVLQALQPPVPPTVAGLPLIATPPTETPAAPTATVGAGFKPAPTVTPVPSSTVPATLSAGADKMVAGAPMVYVTAGEVVMGSDSGGNDEKPVHKVYLDSYWIDKLEVTNALYKKCVDEGKCAAPSETKSKTRDSYYGNSLYDDYPVIYVSWNDAAQYCQWAGKRLPTEAEWEKAARGTDGRVFPWGNFFNANNLNSYDRGKGDTTQVGSYPSGASPYGALDMTGNVWEWVADWYDANYYASSPGRNPSGPTSGQSRVLRGGSWGLFQYFERAAIRGNDFSDDRGDSFGFRCAQ